MDNKLKPSVKATDAKDLLVRIKTGRARTVASQVARVSEHMFVQQELILDQVSKKRDYAPDLDELLRREMSIDEASKRLGISKSYAYKIRGMR